MRILAHRGLWHKKNEKNTLEALVSAVSCGFGVETDIRDYNGKIVISHNMADASCWGLEDFLKEYNSLDNAAWVALNVKADGLQSQLAELLEEYKINNYFLFDMSIPEMVATRKKKLKFFTRNSDIEAECVLCEYAAGVWMDSFYMENWVTADNIRRHLAAEKLVAVISPEIHGFDHIPLWSMLKQEGLYEDGSVMLCTDKPESAKEYFYD